MPKTPSARAELFSRYCPTVTKLGKPGERRPLAEAQCEKERRVKRRLERVSHDQIRQNLDKKFVFYFQCNVKPLKG